MNNLNKILISLVIILFFVLIYETFFLIKIKHEIGKKNNLISERRLWNPFQENEDLFNFKFDTNINPYREMERIQREFNDFFNKNLNNEDFFENQFFIPGPKVNLEEDNKNYIVKVDIPGVKKDKIKIEIEDNLLTISGEYKSESKEKGDFTTTGSFKKVIPLPGEVNMDKVTTQEKDGILVITLPKLHSGKPQIRHKGEINLI